MITAYDVLVITLVATSAGLAGATLGWLSLRALRHRSIRAALGVVALTAVTVVAASVAAVGALMLVSGHALSLLIATVVAGALAGLAVAAALGRSVARSSAALQDAVRRLGAGEEPEAGVKRTEVVELTALAADLDRAHHSLAEARERERALETSRRELISWVSHDLRTPLAGLLAMTEALEDGVVADRPTVLAYHQRMRSEVQRLSGLIDDLFELSRINAGALQLTLETVDLAALVTDTVAALTPLARRRGVRVVAETDGGPTTCGDAAHLDRVLRNLVSNAIRHTPSDGTVTVTTATVAGGSLLVVSDECGGIPVVDLTRVFEVGFRGGPARSPTGDGAEPWGGHGAGLGLAIAHGIVTAHRGTVAVSNTGDGCRFVVRLPSPDA